MLTSKQRAYLRALANPLSPIFQIGKGGVTEETCCQISNALEARELIKVSVLETAPCTAREAAEALAEDVPCDVVAVLGNRMVLYRPSEEKKRIELPR